MGVVVLDHVTDVLHTVLPAPAAQLPGEVFPQQLGHRVHIGVAYEGRLIRVHAVFPQQIQPIRPVRAEALGQFGGHGFGKGQILICAQPIFIEIQMPVAQLRLVREEARDGLAEIRGVVLPMGLVHRVDQQPDALRVQHVDVFPMGAAVAAQANDPDRPIACRLLPAQRLSGFGKREAHGFPRFRIHGCHGDHAIVVKVRRVFNERGQHISLSNSLFYYCAVFSFCPVSKYLPLFDGGYSLESHIF